MFRETLCPSSGAQEYYTGWFSSCRSGVQLWVVCPFYGMRSIPQTGHNLYNTLELLMMGIMVPETC